MNKKGIVLLIACLACAITTFAQGHKGLKINEVMVQNDSNYVDEFGKRTAWIELYNDTYGTMKMASIYLTNDSTNKTMYLVPRGNVKTNVPPHQQIVFFADNKANDGTFHLNFKLTPGQENTIYVYDADGITLIDKVVVPANLPANSSYALNNGQWEICNNPTPNCDNSPIGANEKVEMFRKHDPNGFVLTIMAMGIVFSALILLSFCFFIFGKINAANSKKEETEEQSEEATSTATASDKEGEVAAAIAMALNQHLYAHDIESNVLTIKHNPHSDWNSKTFSMNNK